MPGIEFLIDALTPLNLLLAVAGVVAGTVIGALPGLTATMAVAVLVPFTFGMRPDSALIAMGAIYTGAIYGGAYAAVLLNTPGTPSAIATTFDGYPMARRGDGDLAITLACLASVCGGLVGAAFLLLLAPPLARFALAFGPVEYFWLAIFGLTLIASLSEGSLLRGMIFGDNFHSGGMIESIIRLGQQKNVVEELDAGRGVLPRSQGLAPRVGARRRRREGRRRGRPRRRPRTGSPARTAAPGSS